MLEIGYDHRITLEFSNTRESKDLNHFAMVIKKCYKESKKAGFRNMFNKDERVFIENLFENLTGQVAEKEFITSDRKTFVED